MDWKDYNASDCYDELIGPNKRPRLPARFLIKYLNSLSEEEIGRRRTAAELAIKEMGISFTVYTDQGNIDRTWPFDIIPRPISLQEWQRTAEGLQQRLTALNLFIDDLYHQQKIIADGVVPRQILEQSKNFRPECMGANPAFGVWAHICGTDLVKDRDGRFYVLEDNLRVPSGVSYMVENRQVTKRVLPELFETGSILPVDDYPVQLHETLSSLSPRKSAKPRVVVLTPGIYNSAYFEHAWLAQRMGAELVEGSDLVVDAGDRVQMRTIAGLQQVDVIYRRIDDWFLDPEVFNPDSVLGVPGLMRAWRKGKVAIANAPGAGVADDKVVYAYVPAIIRYYLDQDPILPNVETFICADKKQREYVLENLHRLVVKPANESGGYGMMIGPFATKKQHAEFASLIRKSPRNYIAQPTLSLSAVPTLCEGNRPEPRHVDLRPFILQAANTYVTTGGLTRVALKKGSLVVNSSQGGGSKDTWIIDPALDKP